MSDCTPARPDAPTNPPKPTGGSIRYSNDEQRLIDWLRNTYCPAVLDSGLWEHIRPFTVEIVERTVSTHTYTTLQRAVSPIAQFVSWAHFEQGVPLKTEVMFRPELAERWLAQCNIGNSTKGTYRWVLTQAGRAVTKRAAWNPPEQPFSRGRTAEPYTGTHVRRLLQLKEQQPNAERGLVLNAALTLGLGAGTNGRSLPRVRRDDLVERGGVWSVRLANPSRLVPVLPAFQESVKCLAERTAHNELVIGSSRRAENLLPRIARAHQIDISLARLRSTYIVTLLQADLPLPVLVHLTGIAGGARLGDFLRYVPRCSPAAAQRAVLGVAA